MINYKTYSDLNKDIKDNLHKIPRNIDLIVGIPRSGMLAGMMLGFLRNLPVVSVSEFLKQDLKIFSYRKLNTNDIKNILVIDDSICGGRAMTDVKKLLEPLTQYHFFYFAVYAKEDSKDLIDGYCQILPMPRIFQWNYLNHPYIENACFDIDGLLCYDPTNKENDDGEKYIQFLLNAKPLFIPKYKIKNLVTSRLEKYRKYTEEWLKRNKIEYENLFMLNLPSKEARIQSQSHARFKAQIYKKSQCSLFYESDKRQAIEIFNLTQKPIFCVETDELLQSNKRIQDFCIEKTKYQKEIKFLGIRWYSMRIKKEKEIHKILGIKIVLKRSKRFRFFK